MLEDVLESRIWKYFLHHLNIIYRNIRYSSMMKSRTPITWIEILLRGTNHIPFIRTSRSSPKCILILTEHLGGS
jgi:hypothetical protein